MTKNMTYENSSKQKDCLPRCLIGIYMKILCMLLPFVQRYKKILKKTNYIAKKKGEIN